MAMRPQDRYKSTTAGAVSANRNYKDIDLVVDICCGRVTALIVPGPCRFLGLFGREDDYVIPWLCIKRIGDDLILVDGPLSEWRTPRKKRSLF